jgi:hypothetical protein
MRINFFPSNQNTGKYVPVPNDLKFDLLIAIKKIQEDKSFGFAGL